MASTNEGTSRPLEEQITGSLGELPGVGGLGAGFESGGIVTPGVAQELVPVPGEPEPAPIAVPKALTYASGNFGSGVFYAFNNYMQVFFLTALGAPPIVYALLGSQRSFEGAIIQPLIGAWSDRTWNRLGRRRPFIVGFIPLCIVFTFATPFLPAVAGIGTFFGLGTGLTALILVSVSIFLFSVTFNISQDPYSALMADITPARQRGLVNGISQSVSAIGQVSILVVGFVLGVPYTILYPLVAVMLLIFYLPTVLGIREPRVLAGVTRHHRYTARDYWRALRADRQIQFYFAVQFFLWFGINAIVIFITPYGVNVVGLSPTTSFILPIILLLSTGLSAWPLGHLSDRLGLKRVFFLGVLLMAAASLTAIFLRDPLSLYIILAFAGLGYSATQATGYPLLSRLVFPEQMGLYTGLNSTVSSVAAPLSAVIAGALVGTPALGYGVLFIFVAASFLMCLVPLLFVRLEKSLPARARAAAKAATQPGASEVSVA